jgi:hypothetical protein
LCKDGPPSLAPSRGINANTLAGKEGGGHGEPSRQRGSESQADSAV